jgi:biotin carboxyl carrier protein
MTGTIKEILVAEGDRVVEGERLIVMEAMKMEIDVSAHTAGTVAEVLAAAGSTVREREPLMRIE